MNMREEMKKQLRGKLISLKVDATTKGSRSFLGVNIQYIDEGVLKLQTLAVKEMLTRHTGKNIRHEIIEILDMYEIKVENIITLTTDTGSNMLKAAELIQESQEDVAQELIDEVPETEYELATLDFKLQSIRCAAHTLQLAVDDAVKETDGLRELLDVVRKMARHLRTPCLVRLLKKESLPTPVLDVTTRWSSIYDMLVSVHRLKNFIHDEDIERSQGGKDGNSTPKENALSEEQWDSLEETIEALEPAKIATKRLQEEQLLLSDMYGVWLECKFKTAARKSALAKALRDRMDEREKGRINKEGNEKLPPLLEYPGFLAALFMDPRYFSVLNSEQQESAKKYLVNLWKRLEKLRSPVKPDSIQIQLLDNEVRTSSVMSDEDDDDDCEISAFLKAQDVQRRNDKESWTKVNILTMLDQYYKHTRQLSRKKNLLEFWESRRLLQPELYTLATTVLAIPATQVSVERLFSSLRYVMSPLRYNLTADIIDDVLLIHNNDFLGLIFLRTVRRIRYFICQQ